MNESHSLCMKFGSFYLRQAVNAWRLFVDALTFGYHSKWISRRDQQSITPTGEASTRLFGTQ